MVNNPTPNSQNQLKKIRQKTFDATPNMNYVIMHWVRNQLPKSKTFPKR